MIARLRVRIVSGAVLLLVVSGMGLSSRVTLAQTAPGIDQPVSTEKLDYYIGGFNLLIGTFGLPEEAGKYAEQHIASKTVNESVSVSAGWIGLGNDELKKGQSIPDGGLGELDAAVGEMITVLDSLVVRLKGLEGYYESRGQIEDKFARGKREDVIVLADFKTALAALKPLNAALQRAGDRRDMANLLALKADGDIIGYNGGLAVQRAKHLIDLIHTRQDLQDKEVTSKADTLAAAILAAIADENTALATAAGGDMGHGMRNSTYGLAAKRLQSLVGAYRDMKRTGDLALHETMVESYNAAVENMNIED